MNWRTDKPTAKLIVADITGSRYPEVLKLGSDCYYGTVEHLPVNYDSIEKWADLEEDEPQGWISVKDRLPENDDYVITCKDINGTPQYVGLNYYKDGKWIDEDYCEQYIGHIDYWMPIPKFKEK